MILNTRSIFILIVAVGLVIGGLLLGAYAATGGRPAQNTSDLEEENQSLVPHPPFIDELWGFEISREEANELATLSGLDLRIPQNLPPSYILTNVRADGFRVNPDGTTQPGVILLVFAPSGTNKEDLIPSKFPEVKAFRLYVSRGSTGHEESFLDAKANQGPYDIFNAEGEVIGQGNQVVIGEAITVNGFFAVHSPGFEDDRPGPIREINWVDGNTRFLLAADAKAFPLAGLLPIAESI